MRTLKAPGLPLTSTRPGVGRAPQATILPWAFTVPGPLAMRCRLPARLPATGVSAASAGTDTRRVATSVIAVAGRRKKPRVGRGRAILTEDFYPTQIMNL